MQLYNTMSRSIEEFRPREKGVVKIFTCGPSIYRRPHIGNYRTFMYEDILVKYLEYLGYRVQRAMPQTDIEDKTISEALKKKIKIEDLTDDVAKIFASESKVLKIRLPGQAQRSSHCVSCAADLIQELMEKGFAYRYGKDIFFDPLRYKGFGRLFGLDMKRWPKKKIRFRRDTYTGNRWNLGDFILWHGYRDGDISWWDTGIGKGRPSWNIQDPSVIIRHLGYEIDINCGGIDNIYRHHDYNIAVMESVSGKTFARYYMHGEHLIADGKTMSKSRDNIIYPENLYSQGYAPHHLRFFLLYRHYRRKLNYTARGFDESSAFLDHLRGLCRGLLKPGPVSQKKSGETARLIKAVRDEFEAAMDDDLNAGKALDRVRPLLIQLHEIRLEKRLHPEERAGLQKILKKIDSVLGILL